MLSKSSFPQEYTKDQLKQAEERGRRQQEVDGRLDEHDKQFVRLNGSIERLARGQEETTKELGRTNEKLGEVASEVRTAKDVAETVSKQTQMAIDRQFTRNQLWIGIGGILVALVGLAIANHLI